MSTERRIRRTQTVTPFGVGAVFDIVGESLVACDISEWRGRSLELTAPRIASLMGVRSLRIPPPAPERGTKGAGVPFHRFPQWLFCPALDCRRLTRWTIHTERTLTPGDPPRCKLCRKRPQLVPMRFVMICGNGHLDDVDWRRWAHSRPSDRRQETCQKTDSLVFRVAEQRGGGLASLFVACLACDARRDLAGIASPHTPKSLGWQCRGRQPWQAATAAQNCGADPIIVQRGASNVHFPAVASALDIPPESDFDRHSDPAVKVRAHPDFGIVLRNPEHPAKEGLLDGLAQELGVTRAFVDTVLADALGEDAAPEEGPEFSEEQIRRDEWSAFTTRRNHVPDHRDRFVAEHMDLAERSAPAAVGQSADLLIDRLDLVVKAPRLREVRVLQGFRRYTMDRLVPADLTGRLEWLPAIEVYGEGIFMSFAEAPLTSWEQAPAVVDRVRDLGRRRNASMFSKFLPEVSPRLVMLHTFAHIVIRQLVYETGYSSSSLRERLYVEPIGSGHPMAGVLLYTGAGDAEGTLGGLVRAGDPDWLVPTIIAALQRAEWCSLDPVCRESTAQGPDGLSKAACHACSLLAETSCEYSNALLDRTLLTDATIGYFGAVVAAANQEQAEAAL